MSFSGCQVEAAAIGYRRDVFETRQVLDGGGVGRYERFVVMVERYAVDLEGVLDKAGFTDNILDFGKGGRLFGVGFGDVAVLFGRQQAVPFPAQGLPNSFGDERRKRVQ